MIINQWVPAAHRGDAIGDSARRVRELLRGMGHRSDLYALTRDDDLAGDVRPFSDSSAMPGDLTIFHFALPSPMTSAFASLDGGRILQYHNVTPARFFAPYDPVLFRLATLGRQELATLVGRVDLALGDPRDRRDVALDRCGLLAGLHLRTDECTHGVGIRREERLAHGFAVRLEDRPVRLLRAQRIDRVSALRHRLPFEQVRQRAVEHRLRRDRHWLEFRAPLGHFHLIHRFSKEIKNT